MALESSRIGSGADRLLKVLPRTLGLLAVWSVWLTMVSAIRIPWHLSLTASGVVLLMGAFVWPFWGGFAVLLLMSLIFTAVSLTPSGFFWVALAMVFCMIKLASYRFSIMHAVELALAAFLVTVALDGAQILLTAQISQVKELLSVSLVLRLLGSALVMGIFALILSRPILAWMEDRV